MECHTKIHCGMKCCTYFSMGHENFSTRIERVQQGCADEGMRGVASPIFSNL